ncbi:MAG TPA: hypothetical protein DCS93_44165 [Microscillaceae bacterium]|nr:hypothetical protein [Microscillaceae bacterium]
MQTPEFVEKTQLQIARGQLDAALEGLTEFVKDNKTLYKAALNQAGHYAELERKVDAGTILPQEADVQRAQIRTSVLNLLDRLEQTENKAATKKNKMPQMALIGLGVIVLVIAGVFIGQRLNKDNNQNNKTNNVVAKIDSSANGEKGKKPANSSNDQTTDTTNQTRPTTKSNDDNTTNTNPVDNNAKNTTNGHQGNLSAGVIDFDAIKLDVQVKTHKPVYSVADGEDIQVLVKVNKPSFVTVIYNEESGKKAALTQNKFIDKNRINQWVIVSNGSIYASTQGNESVFAIALNKRLPTLAEKDDYIITDLTNWLRGVEQKVSGEIQGRGIKRRYSNAKYNFKSQ